MKKVIFILLFFPIICFAAAYTDAQNAGYCSNHVDYIISYYKLKGLDKKQPKMVPELEDTQKWFYKIAAAKRFDMNEFKSGAQISAKDNNTNRQKTEDAYRGWLLNVYQNCNEWGEMMTKSLQK